MKASGLTVIWKRQETQPHEVLMKSNANMKTVFLILTIITLLCEFPENMMHKFCSKSYKDTEMFISWLFFVGGGEFKNLLKQTMLKSTSFIRPSHKSFLSNKPRLDTILPYASCSIPNTLFKPSSKIHRLQEYN